jgi:hypothetical protein
VTTTSFCAIIALASSIVVTNYDGLRLGQLDYAIRSKTVGLAALSATNIYQITPLLAMFICLLNALFV